MNSIFLKTINTSIIGSITILFILVLRFFLRNSSKKFSYILWLILLIKLIFPFSLESKFNPMPDRLIKFTNKIYLEGLNKDVGYNPNLNINMDDGQREIEYKVKWENGKLLNKESNDNLNVNIQEDIENQQYAKEQVSSRIQAENSHKNKLIIGNILPCIWLAGVILFMVKGILSNRRLNAILKDSTYLFKNIYENNHINTAFIHGIIRPKIYIPAFLNNSERKYIILHEQTHIKRYDHIVKFLYFIILSLHWFNPLMWLSFYLMEKDMELSCDEIVMNKMGNDGKEDYCRTLLSLATGDKLKIITPLAFSENNTKDRVKNILNYKRPKFWVSAVLILIIIVTGFFIFTIPKSPRLQINIPEDIEDKYGLYNRIFEDPRDVVDVILEKEIEKVKEYTQEDINIEEARVTRFKWRYNYEGYLDNAIEVYEFGYKIKGKELLDYPFTDIYPDGSLTEESLGTGKPLLALAIVDFKEYRNGVYILPKYEFLGFIYYGELYSDSRAEIEIGLIELLENLGLKEYGSFPGDHIVAEYKLRQGETYKLLLSQPAKSGEEGIWCVDRWMDNNGNLYHPIIKGKLSLKEYYGQIQDRVDGGENLALLNGEAVALNFVKDYLDIDYAKAYNFQFNKNASVEDFLIKPINEYYGYIMEFVEYDWAEDVFIHFDKLEFLHSVDPQDMERLKELEINPDKLDNGFYIHNPTSYPETFKVEKDTKFYIIDHSIAKQVEANLDEFMEYYKENKEALFMLEDSNFKLRKVAQVYLP